MPPTNSILNCGSDYVPAINTINPQVIIDNTQKEFPYLFTHQVTAATCFHAGEIPDTPTPTKITYIADGLYRDPRTVKDVICRATDLLAKYFNNLPSPFYPEVIAIIETMAVSINCAIANTVPPVILVIGNPNDQNPYTNFLNTISHELMHILTKNWGIRGTFLDEAVSTLPELMYEIRDRSFDPGFRFRRSGPSSAPLSIKDLADANPDLLERRKETFLPPLYHYAYRFGQKFACAMIDYFMRTEKRSAKDSILAFLEFAYTAGQQMMLDQQLEAKQAVLRAMGIQDIDVSVFREILPFYLNSNYAYALDEIKRIAGTPLPQVYEKPNGMLALTNRAIANILARKRPNVDMVIADLHTYLLQNPETARRLTPDDIARIQSYLALSTSLKLEPDNLPEVIHALLPPERGGDGISIIKLISMNSNGNNENNGCIH